MASKICIECGAKAGKHASECKRCSGPLRDCQPAVPVEKLTDEAISALEAEAAPAPEPREDGPGSAREAAAGPAPAGAGAISAIGTPEGSSPPADVPAAYVLTVMNGLSAGLRMQVPGDGSPLLAGAGGDADFRITGDDTLSRRHASFQVAHGVLTVTDERSTNGSYLVVSGNRTLESGDILVLGNTVIRVDEA